MKIECNIHPGAAITSAFLKVSKITDTHNRTYIFRETWKKGKKVTIFTICLDRCIQGIL